MLEVLVLSCTTPAAPVVAALRPLVRSLSVSFLFWLDGSASVRSTAATKVLAVGAVRAVRSVVLRAATVPWVRGQQSTASENSERVFR